MAENKQTFILVGSFQDNITPKLRKLDTQISALTRTFSKFSSNLRPISKELGVMAMAAERLANTQRTSRSTFEGNVRVLKEYKKTIGQVAAAQRSLSQSTPRSLPTPAMPRGGRGGMGGGGGVMPPAPRQPEMETKGIGFWGLTAATATANLAVQAATQAFQTLTGSLNSFVQKGSQAEQAVTQMSGTLMTLGKVGDYGKSREIADKMMGDLGKVAAKLPGSTEDYLSILQQTLDDQIQAFGSVEAVQKNLAGYDPETGKKLAGGVEQSFTALLGMSAQIAGMAPQVAAMDLNQLRQSPQNIRNVQLLTRNPTLAKYYQEELKKSGGNFIKALDKAMQRAIPKEQIEALKNSFDSAYQSFVTTFTDPYSGIFGPMRKVKIKVNSAIEGFGDDATRMVNSMEILGVIMRNINDILGMIMGMNMFDPLQAINQFLFEVAVQFTILRLDLEDLAKGDLLNLGTLAETIGRSIGEAAGNFANWILNLDYEQFFKDIDTLVYNFFKGLFEGFLSAFKGVEGSNKGPLGAFGSSVSGTVVSVIALTLAFQKLAAVVSAVAAGIAAFKASALFAGLTTAISALPGIIAGAASTIAAAALPALAIVGALLALFAILRHGDFIVSSLWESLKLLGNAFMWAVHGVQEFLANLKAGLFRFLSTLPGIGGWFKGMAADAEKEAQLAHRRRLDREKAMQANVAKINDNNKKSWERTQADAKTLREKLAGLGKGTVEQQKAAAKAAAALNELEKASSKAADAEKPKQKPKPKAPDKGPTMANRNYTVGGITYDWKTGMPVKPGAKPPEKPKPKPKPAAKPTGGGIYAVAPLATAAKPTPAVAPKPAAPAPVAPAKPVQATIPPQSFAPVVSAISAGNAATNGVKASVDSVKVAVQIAQQVSTAQFQAQMKLTGLVIAGLNAVKSGIMAVSSKVSTQASLSRVEGNTDKSNSLLLRVEAAIKAIPSTGGMGAGGIFNLPSGDGVKKVVAAGKMLQGMGLNVAENPYFGTGRVGKHATGSYHYAGRAVDVTGPPAVLDAAYAKLKGTNPAELLWRTAGHYDHLHVAYAHGLKRPTFFTSAREAVAYERYMAPASAQVSTITTNSSENLGNGHTTVNQNISISGAQDPQKLAELVFDYAARAAQRVNNASFA